jgi:hypothetical protein
LGGEGLALDNHAMFLHQRVDFERRKLGARVSVVEVDKVDGVGVVEDSDGFRADAAHTAFTVVDDGDATRTSTSTGRQSIGANFDTSASYLIASFGIRGDAVIGDRPE